MKPTYEQLADILSRLAEVADNCIPSDDCSPLALAAAETIISEAQEMRAALVDGAPAPNEPNATMIALDTDAVLDEIAELKSNDCWDHEVTPTRAQVNKALCLCHPSDGFYMAFDELRRSVIQYACEIASDKS